MKYLHTMIRISDIDKSLRLECRRMNSFDEDLLRPNFLPALANMPSSGLRLWTFRQSVNPSSVSHSGALLGRYPYVLTSLLNRYIGFLALIILCFAFTPCLGQALTDDQVRFRMIQDSIRSFPGNCPCPYSIDSTGDKCGKSSAWNKAGEFAPLCYAKDVTKNMVKTYRQLHGLGQ